MKQSLSLIMMLAFLCLNAGPANAMNGREIMEKNEALQSADYEDSVLSMTLINENGRKRERELEQKIKHDEDGLRYRYIHFLKPGDIKGTKLLTLENKDGDDTQWFFMPAVRRARRISAADNTDSFVGSELSFEDLRREKLNQYNYQLEDEAEIDGQMTYLLDITPSSESKKKESGYARREIWISKKTFLTVKEKFYDKNGGLLKVFHASDFRQLPGGEWRSFKLLMENVQIGHKTELIYKKIEIGKKISDRIFSERSLQ